MIQEYTFPHIEKFRRLRMYVSNKDGRLTFKLIGPHAFWLRPIFWLYFRMFRRVRPIAQREGGNVYSLFFAAIPSPAHTREFENLLRQNFFGERIPLAVTIAVTNLCQCRCLHCSLPEPPAGERELTLEELQRVVRESLDLGVINITFTGGEPLLRKDLEQVIAMVPQEKAVSLVFTNGIELTQERLRSLKQAGLAGIQVSLDSPDPAEHNALRRMPGLFERVRSGIQRAHVEGMLIGLSTYASNDFVEKKKLSGIAELGAAWGVHELTVFDAIATGRFLHRSDVMLTPDNRKRLIAEGLCLRRNYLGRMHVVTQSWTNSNKGLSRIIGCLAGHIQFHVSATGHVRPCDFTPLSLGNVRQESVAELWKKLTRHPAFRKRCHECRMQSPDFRRRYIGVGPQRIE